MPKLKFDAIGTKWLIETAKPLPDVIREAIAARIELFDKTYSRFRDDSLVTKLRTPGTYVFPEDVEQLMAFYRKLYDMTQRAVTPLIGEVLEDAGYDAQYSLTPRDVLSVANDWNEAMDWKGRSVTVKKPITLDVGAAGKGYLVDLIAEILMSHNIDEYVIDASGDICHRGSTVEQIGLENPFNSETVIGTARLQNASLCASASNRRAWGEWHHIIDPRTGSPVRDVVATWVVADTTILADGLATALFFVSPAILSDWKFEAVRLFADGRIEYTPGFVGELFI